MSYACQQNFGSSRVARATHVALYDISTLVNGATCVAPGGRGPGIPHKWPLVASRIKTNVIFEFSAVSYIKEQVFRLMQLKGEF